MNAEIKRLMERFDRLARRERILILLASASLVLALAYGLVIDPAITQSKSLTVRIADQRGQIDALRSNRLALESQISQDVNAQVRGQLENVTGELSALDGEIKGFHQTLIPAQAMSKVLGGLLAQSEEVRLISLRNIPPEPLILGEPEKPSGAAAHKGKGLIYKHGIELVVEGGYLDLLGYLAKLEQQPWRVLWGQTSLTAEYPKARLQMTLYTLSLDYSWLSV